jgi:putative FmdB family regulatory protein
MPTYDYECKACGHRFDELQTFSEPPLTRCPACKKNKLERLFGGGGAIIFKGSGFYETDYRRAGTNGTANGDGKEKADPGDAAATKTEAKAEPSTPAATPAEKPAASDGAGKSGGKGSAKKKG